MLPTFTLLTLAILALWVGGEERHPRWRQVWLVLLFATAGSAFAGGYLAPLGFGWLLAMGVATWGFSRPTSTLLLKTLAAVAILALSAGLMLHLLPGFRNPRVLDAVRFTPDAMPYSLYLNLDKTVAGILLIGFGHSRIRRISDWGGMLRRALPWAAGLLVLIMLLSLAAGYVRFAPKWPAATALWLWVNLCFTCLAEEALFRGFIQGGLQRAWERRPWGQVGALGIAAVLFGLAHAAGGPTYVALATVAGVGYGWVYQRTGRIEASILTHFALNTVHFLLFTYPAIG